MTGSATAGGTMWPLPMIGCPAALPPWLCGYGDVVQYLLPPLLLALVFRMLARRHAVFFGFYLSGTILHELAHLLAGWATNARPVDFTVFPRRASGRRWILGSVSFANIRWYNAAVVGLAPVLTLAVPVLAAFVRVRWGQPYDWTDAAIAVLIAPAFLSFMPSRIDLLIALRSWPYFAGAGAWLWWSWH